MTLSGIVMLVKLVQLENASIPMHVTLFGIVILVKDVQPENALDGIYASQPNSILEPLPVGPAVFKFVQPENAELPMFVTLFGIVTLVNDAQQLNASSPILVTLSGIVMLVKLVHL